MPYDLNRQGDTSCGRTYSYAVFGARYVLTEDSHVPRGPFPPGLPILVKVDRWKESLVEISMRLPSSRFQVVDFVHGR